VRRVIPRTPIIVAASGHIDPAVAIVDTENFTALPAASLLSMPVCSTAQVREMGVRASWRGGRRPARV